MFGTLDQAALDPILDYINKAGGNMIQKKIPGDIFYSIYFVKPGGHQLTDILTEISQKQFAAFAGEHAGDVFAVFLPG